MEKTIEIPEGYEARIEDNKVIIEPKESEDEIIRNRIIGYLKQDIEEHPERKERIEDMLAWLEKQGSQQLANSAKTCKDEQNPAWSKEDDEHINSLLKRLEGLCRKELIITRFAVNEDEDWLKSLKERYTWKPSDEQIKGIECAIKTLQHQLNVGDKRLDSLYNELKKLKG